MEKSMQTIVIISANIEWRAIHALFPYVDYQHGPYGEWFTTQVAGKDVIFLHGGWGKIAAAASAQYAIAHWRPALLVNLGTCGGFEGEIERGEIVLVEKTIVYDIIEQMGDFDEHIDHYTTQIDLSWLQPPYPQAVRRTLLVSGDRDLLVDEIPMLKERYGAVAGDWESGAIAWVAARNRTRLLILRGVTDLVGIQGGEAYGKIEVFEAGTQKIMQRLVEGLAGWVSIAAYINDQS